MQILNNSYKAILIYEVLNISNCKKENNEKLLLDSARMSILKLNICLFKREEL